MKKIFFYILSIVLNVGVYILLSIIDVLVDFLVFGTGATNNRSSLWLSLCFLLLQILILLFLYKKKILVKNLALLISNILITVCLFLYFVVYLANN